MVNVAPSTRRCCFAGRGSASWRCRRVRRRRHDLTSRVAGAGEHGAAQDAAHGHGVILKFFIGDDRASGATSPAPSPRRFASATDGVVLFRRHTTVTRTDGSFGSSGGRPRRFGSVSFTGPQDENGVRRRRDAVPVHPVDRHHQRARPGRSGRSSASSTASDCRRASRLDRDVADIPPQHRVPVVAQRAATESPSRAPWSAPTATRTPAASARRSTRPASCSRCTRSVAFHGS